MEPGAGVSPVAVSGCTLATRNARGSLFFLRCYRNPCKVRNRIGVLFWPE